MNVDRGCSLGWVMASACVVLCCGLCLADTTLRILHFNDVHARIEPAGKFQGLCTEEALAARECYGGFAKVAKIVKEKRGVGDDLLVLDAGDEFMGTLWNTFYKGNATARIMNALGVDAMALGNHEFDYGPEVLGGFLDQLDVPVVCTNIITKNEPALRGKILPSITLDINGISVGVIGYTIPEIPIISEPGDKVTFSDVVPSMQATINILKEQGVQIFIGLGHIGYDEDLALASELSSIDIIVGGHSHTKPEEYPKIVKNKDGKNVLVVQAFWASRYVGYLEAYFDDTGYLASATGELIELGDDPNNPDNYVEDDPDMASLIAEMKGPVEDFGKKVIGRTDVLLDGERQSVRGRETNFGDLVCEAMILYMQSQSNFVEANGDVRLCITNGGGIRNSVDIGDITVEDSLMAQPFGNVITVLQLTPSDIYTALEAGVRRAGEFKGEFPQVGGIRFKYCSTLPSGERVSTVEIFDGTDFVPVRRDDTTTQLNLVTTDFLAGGGDGYSVFEEVDVLLASGDPVDVAFNDYLVLFSPITIEVDGRIVDLCQ